MDQRPFCAPRRFPGAAIDRRRMVRGIAGLGLAATGVAGWFALRTATAAEPYAATPAASPVASPIASQIASPTAGVQVAIDNFSFNPPALTIAVGTEVTWVNHDDIPHTVTSADTTTFASELLDTDDTFAYRFDTPGTFPYFCSLHPFMTASVVVQ